MSKRKPWWRLRSSRQTAKQQSENLFVVCLLLIHPRNENSRGRKVMRNVKVRQANVKRGARKPGIVKSLKTRICKSAPDVGPDLPAHHSAHHLTTKRRVAPRDDFGAATNDPQASAVMIWMPDDFEQLCCKKSCGFLLRQRLRR